MDLAYDHIQEEAYLKNAETSGEAPKKEGTQSSLNSDIQEAYKAFSASPWGAKLGGFFGNVVKQGESVYTQASKEFAEVREDATKGFTSLRETVINRTRSLSLTTVIPDAIREKDHDDNQTTPTNSKGPSAGEGSASQESETVLSRLRTEAAKRLKDLQKAEDAADEALLKFGSNIRDFLRDAISIAPPDESNKGDILFESKDASGKRVIHSSRFDAQLHVIHSSTESFTKDPSAGEYEQWTQDFDLDKKTEDISGDLSKYPELRSTMEKLVPDQIPYADFWKRYYFLRHGIETAESRRRDLLKAASTEDEVAWDDSDEEETDKTDKSEKTDLAKSLVPTKGKRPESVASSTTIHPPVNPKSLKPDEPRKSHDEKSEADTDTSYDVVGASSGKTSQVASQAPNSPKDPKKEEESDDSDEEEEEEDEEEDDSDDDEEDDDDSDEDWE